MKKIILINIALVALTMLTSCLKEQFSEKLITTEGVTEFTATIAQTKTAIDNDGKVTWTAGDEITVTDGADHSAVYLAMSSGVSTTFTLKGGQTAVGNGPYTAKYGDITNQVYDDKGANCPLTAKSSSSYFTFSSPYAVVKVTAKSETGEDIKSVVVKYGEKDYTLNCGDGVTLTSEGKDFFVAVEPSTTDAALSVTFYNAADKKSTKTRSSTVTLAAKELLHVEFDFTGANWEDLPYVEIGGMKWATKNLGATTVAGSYATCAGDYYAWGETEPYYGTLTWNGNDGTFANWPEFRSSGYASKSYCGQESFQEWSTPPYDNSTKILKAEYDAATKELGDDWRMPTSQEFKDLADACGGMDDYNMTTYASPATCGEATTFSKGIYWCDNYDGVAGVLFCDGTNKLFFPAAGFGYCNDLVGAGEYGYYWSSSLSAETTEDAVYLLFYLDPNGVIQSHETRFFGLSVRPVYSPAPAYTGELVIGNYTITDTQSLAGEKVSEQTFTVISNDGTDSNIAIKNLANDDGFVWYAVYDKEKHTVTLSGKAYGYESYESLFWYTLYGKGGVQAGYIGGGDDGNDPIVFSVDPSTHQICSLQTDYALFAADGTIFKGYFQYFSASAATIVKSE